MTETVIFENRITDQEEVKLIRWPVKNKNRVIFQALGKLYEKKKGRINRSFYLKVDSMHIHLA